MMRALVFGLLLLSACKGGAGMQASAKEDFGKRYSCPMERIDVRERKEVDPAALMNPDTKESPPDEVKKDPGRLAKWNADRKESWEKTAAGYRRSFTVYEAKGCDHDVLLACTNADNVGTTGTTVVCHEKPLTAANPQ